MNTLIKNYIKNINISINDNQNINTLKIFLTYIKNQDIVIDETLYDELIRIEEIVELLEKTIKSNITINDSEVKRIIDYYCKNIEYQYLKEEYEYSCEVDGFKQYIKDISKYKLLTQEETIELFKNIKINNDETAKEKLVLSNLRLVVTIAKRYYGKGIELLDLIQEGNKALIKAVENFNYDKGYRFSTYAFCCVEDKIKTAIRTQNRNIRIPLYMLDKINNYKTQKQKLIQSYGRNLNIEELSEYLFIPISEIKQYEFFLNDTISLDLSYGNDKENKLEKYIPSSDESIEEKLDKDELKNELKTAMNKLLTEQEIDILKKRFGFDCERVYTLKELGKKYSVSCERIRHIQDKALNKIKNSSYRNILIEFLNNTFTESKINKLESIKIKYNQDEQKPENNIEKLVKVIKSIEPENKYNEEQEIRIRLKK